MLENTSKPLRRLAIIIEFLVALAVLISGALKLLPFGGVPGLVVIGVVSVCLRRKGLRGIGLEGRPGLAQTDRILTVANRTGVDPTLLAVTWRFEGSLDQYGEFNFQPTNGMHTPTTNIGDVGPGQLYPPTWNKSPYTDGLSNPFGTNINQGQVFNGNAFENLIVAGRALGKARGAQRAHSAGIYRAGSSTNPGYGERVQNFKDHRGNYDRFFECLAKKGFSP